MFQKILDDISNKFSEHFEKKKQEQEHFERMQREFEFNQRIQLNERDKQEAFKSAQQDAFRRAKTKTGIERLRAINRAERLGEQGSSTFFSKLSMYTQKNMKRVEQNKARTKLIREHAEKMKRENLEKRQMQRNQRMNFPGRKY